MSKLGTRCLPKYLCNKLGYDNVKQAVTNGETREMLDVHLQSKKRGTKSYSHSFHPPSKQRWRLKQQGELPEDPLYSPEEALDLAGIP